MPKISLLPPGTTVTGPEIFPAVQAGGTVGLTPAQLGAYTVTAFGLLQLSGISGISLGTQPYAAHGSYIGAASNSPLFASRGGSGSLSVTDNGATAVFQQINNAPTDNAVTLYASLRKRGPAGGRTAWFEAEDVNGAVGSYLEGFRGSALLSGGTAGNATGVVSVALATAQFAYVVGGEHQVWNLYADATTTFSAASFSCGVLSSNLGTKKSDAAYVSNPDSTTPFVTGALIAAGSVTDTAYRCDANIVYGMDLSRGTYSGAPIVAPLATPASSSATGKAGSLCWDAGFIYVCTATNTWKRAALSTF